MYYKGWLQKNNKQFDACLTGKPFKFRLGAGEVIKVAMNLQFCHTTSLLCRIVIRICRFVKKQVQYCVFPNNSECLTFLQNMLYIDLSVSERRNSFNQLYDLCICTSLFAYVFSTTMPKVKTIFAMREKKSLI